MTDVRFRGSTGRSTGASTFFCMLGDASERRTAQTANWGTQWPSLGRTALRLRKDDCMETPSTGGEAGVRELDLEAEDVFTFSGANGPPTVDK